MAITARGEILSCVTLRKPLGRVREGGVRNVWRNATRGVCAHGIDPDRFARCSACELLPKCHVCAGHNEAATGDIYEPPIERCYATMALFGDRAA